MMQYDRITLGRQAKGLGFVRDTLEKVCRLADVLAFMEKEPLLRKCVVFYSAIAADKAPECFAFSHIMQLAPQGIKTDLIPVLRRGEHFDLELAQKKTLEYLKSFLFPENSRELEFWQSFNNQEYRPDLLFSDDEFLNRVKRHPMALWKCGGRVKSDPKN